MTFVDVYLSEKGINSPNDDVFLEFNAVRNVNELMSSANKRLSLLYITSFKWLTDKPKGIGPQYEP